MNILMFGPNGSGKGTQGALIKKAFGLAHIESGAIFREHVGGGTELGKKAKEYMDRGELVPDAITIPMVLETLKTKGADGWLLDGFPRNIAQAEQLHKALQEQGMKLDYVVEIDLPRNIARDRIMGRRVCKNDGNHPNNVFIEAIKPQDNICRVCGGGPTTRGQDEKEGTGLIRLNEEDPSFSVVNNAETHQMVVYAAGDIQIDVLVKEDCTIESIKETLIKELGLN